MAVAADGEVAGYLGAVEARRGDPGSGCGVRPALWSRRAAPGEPGPGQVPAVGGLQARRLGDPARDWSRCRACCCTRR